MSRTRGKPAAHARHRKVIKAARGYRGRRKNTFRTAQAAVVKAGQYAYVGRKVKKRDYRSLWIVRINAAVRAIDPEMTYSRFMHGLARTEIALDRKMLSELAIREPAAFRAVYDEVCTALKRA